MDASKTVCHACGSTCTDQLCADGEALQRPIDWRAMFRQYVARVRSKEGVDFLDRRDWTSEEWSALEQAGLIAGPAASSPLTESR